MEENSPILTVRSVSKDFSGNFALKEVSMEFFPGKVNAVVGENGAGKSTLMKIISGVYKSYSGEIIYEGTITRFATPREGEERGVTIIHQELNLIPHLTVAENIFLGREPLTRLGFIDYNQMNRKTGELLSLLHLDISPSEPVNRLRVGQQQLFEIARALQLDSKVLIMDEPTSAISGQETELLFRIIRDLINRGVAVIYISHKLDELFEIADRFLVLRDGHFIGSLGRAEATHEKLIRMMVGRDLIHATSGGKKPEGEPIMKVSNLTLGNQEIGGKNLVSDVSFELHKGEILGVSGLMGAGRTECLEALFGLHGSRVTGEIEIEGKPVVIRSVPDAVDAGLALVPEDRKTQGLILNMTVTRNITLSCLKYLSRFGFIDFHAEKELCGRYIHQFGTKVDSMQMEVDKLSGGNQQKVVIAKWLATKPKILLLDEPTRGIDIGAKSEIYKLIRELASQGLGIIMVSSELPEILALSDRIMVMSESRVTAVFSREEASEEVIMKASVSHENNDL